MRTQTPHQIRFQNKILVLLMCLDEDLCIGLFHSFSVCLSVSGVSAAVVTHTLCFVDETLSETKNNKVKV